MEDSNEFKLAQALFDCSVYCEIISSKDQPNAVRDAVCDFIQNWLDGQGLSEKEEWDLFEKLSKPGPVAHFVNAVIKKRNFETVVDFISLPED